MALFNLARGTYLFLEIGAKFSVDLLTHPEGIFTRTSMTIVEECEGGG
jgi:hypothetical protein